MSTDKTLKNHLKENRVILKKQIRGDDQLIRRCDFYRHFGVAEKNGRFQLNLKGCRPHSGSKKVSTRARWR